MFEVEVVVREMREEDAAAVLRLNLEAGDAVSPMDAARFQQLREMAAFVWVAEADGEVRAFVMCFAAGAEYDSLNYQWFSRRVRNFLYVDRVAVCQQARASGIGGAMYQRVASYAAARGYHWLAAEVNVEPYNAASIKFHERQQFVAVGQQAHGGKRVAMYLKGI